MTRRTTVRVPTFLLRARSTSIGLSSSYRLALGDPPAQAGDIEGARSYLNKIQSILDGDGLTPTERRRLRRMVTRWQRRGNGEDLRWLVMGTKPGRPKTWRRVDAAKK